MISAIRMTMALGLAVLTAVALPAVARGAEGDLTFHSCLVDADDAEFFPGCSDQGDSIDAIEGAHSTTVSPDGKHAYVTGSADDSVTAFSRNVATGELTFVEAETDGVGGVTGLFGASDAVLDPAGKHLYVAGESAGEIAIFGRDVASGALTFLTTVSANNPRALAISPDGKSLYVASAVHNSLTAFSRDSTTGALALIDTETQDNAADGLDAASGVSVSPDGEHVYTAALTGAAVGVFDRVTATGAVSYVSVVRDGIGGVDGLFRPIGIVTSPDGSNVYVASQGGDETQPGAVATFDRDASTGALGFAGAIEDNAAAFLDAATGIDIDPEGKSVAVAAQSGPSLVNFDRDGATGALTVSEVKRYHPEAQDGGPGLYLAFDSEFAPDGTSLYVVGGSTVSVYDRETTDSPGPGEDETPPDGTASGKGKARAGEAIKLEIFSDEAGEVVAAGTQKQTGKSNGRVSATVEVARKKLKVKLKSVQTQIAAGETKLLKLKPKGKKKAKRLKKAVKAGAKAKAKITVDFTDAAGNSSREELSVKLK